MARLPSRWRCSCFWASMKSVVRASCCRSMLFKATVLGLYAVIAGDTNEQTCFTGVLLLLLLMFYVFIFDSFNYALVFCVLLFAGTLHLVVYCTAQRVHVNRWAHYRQLCLNRIHRPQPLSIDYFVLWNCDSFFLFFIDILFYLMMYVFIWGQNKLFVLILVPK